MRIARDKQPSTSDLGEQFAKIIRLAAGPKDKTRAATDNEVWPDARKVEVVEQGPDKLTFRAGAETVTVERRTNPGLFDYVEAVGRMAGPEMNTLRARDERILRGNDSVALQDLTDITRWMVDGETLTFTAKDKDGNGIAISRALTPELFDQVAALQGGNDDGFALQTEDTLLSGEDMDKAEILPPNLDQGFIGLTIDGKKMHVSETVTPELWDQITTYKASQTDIEASIKDGYKEAGATDYPDDDDITRWGMADEFGNGIIRFETEGGDKFVVSEHVNAPLYDRIVAKAEGTQADEVAKLREDYGLPPASDMDVMSQETDALVDDKDASKGKLTVAELATRSLIEEYQKGVDDGSIGKDDPRARLVRALEAKSATQNGRGITGYEETQGLFGGTWRESDDHQTQLTGKDMGDIIDGHAVDTSLEELFADPTVSEDYTARLENALGRIDGGAVEKKLDDLVFGKDSRYMDYIAALKDAGLDHAAQVDIAGTVQSLSILNPEKGKQAAAQLQTNALTMDLNELVANPDLISQPNQTQALKDLFGLLKGVLKAETIDMPRRTIESIDKFVEGFINGNVPEADVIKAVNGAAQEAMQNGGHIPQESLEKYKAYIPAADQEGFMGFMGKMNSMGILGSMGGGVGLISGIYQLAGRGGQLADSPRERLAIAKDFISFVGASGQFATLGDSITKALGGTGKMADILGLKQTVPELWGDKGLNGAALADTVPKNAYVLPEIEMQDWNKFTAETTKAITDAGDRVKAGTGINGSKFIEHLDDVAVDGVQTTFEAQAKAAGLSSLDNFKNIGKTVARVLGPVTDVVGGVADVVLGAFTIKDAIASDSDLGKAAGSLQVIGGAAGLAAGGVGIATAFGLGGAALGAAAGPLFLVGAAFAAIGGIVSYFLDHEKKQKATDAEGQWYKDLAADGLMFEDWGDKVEFARYSAYRYEDRDTPDGESIFEFQKAEWDHFRTTEQSNGSSSNRLDEDLHVDKEMAGFQSDFHEQNREMFDRIQGHWDAWNGSDSIVSDKDLRKYADDPNRSEAEREAARFLLDNKPLFDMLDTRKWDNGKDGKISNNDLNAWLDEVRA